MPKSKAEIEAAMKALQEQLAAIEAADEEEEDTRPLGEKVGSALGKLISGSKKQGSSFFSGLKDELVKGGVIKPKKRK